MPKARLLFLLLFLAVSLPLAAQPFRIKGPPTIKQLTVTSPVVGGNSTVGVVELTETAFGAIKLSSSHPSLAIVPEGLNFTKAIPSQRFEVQTKPVSTRTEVALYAIADKSRAKALLVILPPSLATFDCAASEIHPTQSVQCRACLDGAAAQSIAIEFRSSNGDIATFSKGTAKATDTRSINPSEKCVNEVVFAGRPFAQSMLASVSASYGGATKSAMIKVLPGVIGSLSLPMTNSGTSPVQGGFSTYATVTLTASAPSQGIVLKISAESPATVPETLTITSSNYASFLVATRPVTSNRTVTITVSTDFLGFKEVKTAQLPILAPKIAAITIVRPEALVNVPIGGIDVPATLTLNGPSPGMDVNLSYWGETDVSGPPRVNVAADSKQASFTFRVAPCSISTSCSIRLDASIPGSAGSYFFTVKRQ